MAHMPNFDTEDTREDFHRFPEVDEKKSSSPKSEVSNLNKDDGDPRRKYLMKIEPTLWILPRNRNTRTLSITREKI